MFRYPDYFVRLFCSFQNKDFLFLVQEYIPGGDCMTLLTYFKRFPEYVTQHYIAQVCVAVAHLHNFGVVHRDIKPDNIFVSSLTRLFALSLTLFFLVLCYPTIDYSPWTC
jgi:serine/threonine protein kinase